MREEECGDGWLDLRLRAGRGNRTRLSKTELQRLAEETGLEIAVCHVPPGTCKWNRVEHRLCSFISRNWRECSLASYEVISSIAAPSAATGLEVRARRGDSEYPKAEVADEQFAAVNLATRVPSGIELHHQKSTD